MSQRRNNERNGIDLAIKAAIEEALDVSDWNIANAARHLRVSRVTAWRWAKKFKLMKPSKVMVRRLVKA